MTGHIYFLQVGTDGPIKIGYTAADIKRRVRAIQCGSPHVLRWIGVYAGTMADEKSAHLLLQNSSLRGEWFYPTAEVQAFVRQQCPNFAPLVVENVLVPGPKGKRGSGARQICIARPASLHTEITPSFAPSLADGGALAVPIPQPSAVSAANSVSCGGVEVRHAKAGNKTGSIPEEARYPSATRLAREEVQGAALQPCAGVTPGPQESFSNPAAPPNVFPPGRSKLGADEASFSFQVRA